MTDSIESLTDRIRERVDTARLAIDQRAKAAALAEEERMAQSLKRVFQDLGMTYRRYHSQVGGPVTPGLRDANYKFRERPSFDSLVIVAGYLDGLKLLD